MRLIPQPPGKIVAGEVWFDGDDLVKADEDEIRKVRGGKIAMIFQDPMTSLNPVLTNGRQISESLELHLKLKRSDAMKRSAELLKMVDIPSAEQRLNDYPHQFSGGMRQRVMIAMAISCNPRLLLADEPTTALDVTIQAQILDLIRKLSADLGTSVIIITHDMGVVAGLAQRINVMYAGVIIETANSRELFGNPQHPYTMGLLQSVPRLDEERKERLIPIEGLPPDLIDPPKGCPFAPRCRYVQEKCAERPPLRLVAQDYYALCWFERDTLKPAKEVALV